MISHLLSFLRPRLDPRQCMLIACRPHAVSVSLANSSPRALEITDFGHLH